VDYKYPADITRENHSIFNIGKIIEHKVQYTWTNYLTDVSYLGPITRLFNLKHHSNTADTDKSESAARCKIMPKKN
jgi:hypothetical protein